MKYETRNEDEDGPFREDYAMCVRVDDDGTETVLGPVSGVEPEDGNMDRSFAWALTELDRLAELINTANHLNRAPALCQHLREE